MANTDSSSSAAPVADQTDSASAPLKAARGRIKASVTNFAKFLNDSKPPLDSVSMSKVKERLGRVIPKFAEFTELHYAICDMDKVEDEKMLNTFEDSYDDAVARAKEMLKQSNTTSGDSCPIAVNPIAVNPIAVNPVAVTPVAVNASNVAPKVQLPSISLPTFNGRAEQWFDFRDMFRSLVHEDPTLDNVKKPYYLKGALTGEAKAVIQGIQPNADNYSTIWECLSERYENKRLLIHNHLSEIFNIKPVKSECSKSYREMLDKLNINLRSLQNLGEPIEHWDTIIIFTMCKKLDPITARGWEGLQTKTTVPSLGTFREFLRNRADMLQSVQSAQKPEMAKYERSFASHYAKPKGEKVLKVEHAFQGSCYYCTQNHAIYYCPQFKQLQPEVRVKVIKEMHLCENCLRPGHIANECHREGCRKCPHRHNSLLHCNNDQMKRVQAAEAGPPGEGVSLHTSGRQGNTHTFLSSAIVRASTARASIICRALLDNGSQLNLITKEAARKLGVPVNHDSGSIEGIGDSSVPVCGTCSLTLCSITSDFKLPIECHILPHITQNLPCVPIARENLAIPNAFRLADPNFHKGGSVEVLLGTTAFWEVFNGRISRLGPELPILASTHLGWLVAGAMTMPKPPSKRCLLACGLQERLEKFWEIETFSNDNPPTHQVIERHFSENTVRDETGRFVVAIPFKAERAELGPSRPGAQRRFLQLERRLQAVPQRREQYANFMKEYEALGHMSPMSHVDLNKPHFFLPHHCVTNPHSTTAKLRVVFDGSYKSESELSRNEIEHVGPTVQSDLFSILLRFRYHRFVISADIVKMYRQIKIRDEDKCMQYILWRERPTDELKTYSLNTVTYGTASAAYLATRCLRQAGTEMPDTQISSIIQDDFYVDDLLTGTDSIETGRSLCKALKASLAAYGFELQKWNSNNPQIVDEVTNESTSSHVDLGSTIKMLGLHWRPRDDTFSYSVANVEGTLVTKRTILSKTCQIFDPLGVVGASLIIAKILLQRLWQLRLDWDAEAPKEIQQEWADFEGGLPLLNKLRIPRRAVFSKDFEIHGFADASERAYGACVYARSLTQRPRTYLLCAKAKVAPIKTVTIPRLELCAALLLAKLVRKVVASLPSRPRNIHLWTDSEIVLCWLRKSPPSLKLFVANRVYRIQEITEDMVWRHVPSKENPADLISRGILPSHLQETHLWWHGPPWLSLRGDKWPENTQNEVLNVPELKAAGVVHACVSTPRLIEFQRFSKYTRLLRTAMYVIKFVSKARKSCTSMKPNQPESQVIQASNLLCRLVQEECFRDELSQLKGKATVSQTSRLKALSPFICNDGLLRVGGRLKNADLPFATRHQIILPNHHVTKLMMRHEHIRLGHVGPQALLCSIRERFWPLQARTLAKGVCQACVTCFRARPRSIQPIMSDLPTGRVQAVHPFHTTGVDYAGPFLIRANKLRGTKHIKAYLALFICFATKALHLELVSDLTTEAFMAAFRRFTSRRGLPRVVWSDNGTNFAGACSELKRIIADLMRDDIASIVAIENVDWRFIPANSSHFGGLWESGVRQVKYHLRRLLNNHTLTFEELATVFCQIEAILNSRPLTTLSDDPIDPQPLTPSHFLVGRRLTAIPDDRLEDVPSNRLSRFQLVQQMIQYFWNRWSSEYLHTLQPRVKWTKHNKSIEVGDLVIVMQDHFPPMQWPIARVLEVHPGKDDVVRVATIRLHGGTTRRAVHKLCPFPTESRGDL